MKFTVCPKFTEPSFHVEGAFRFTRSVRISLQFFCQWWVSFWTVSTLKIVFWIESSWEFVFWMVFTWEFVFWMVILACWCKLTITKFLKERAFRPLRIVHVFLLAQRPIWTICWTAAIRIIWSRWPIGILLEADEKKLSRIHCHSHSSQEFQVAFRKLQKWQI